MLYHPIFWNFAERLFIQEVTDKMQVEDKATGSDLLEAIENITSIVVGKRCDRKMHATFVCDIFLVIW